MKKTEQTKQTYFTASGFVHGYYWGGGQGAYASEKLMEATKEKLLNKASEMLKDGSLDGGMGYQSLIGARLDIVKHTILTVNGKEYENEEYSREYIGELTAKQKHFLGSINNY